MCSLRAFGLSDAKQPLAALPAQTTARRIAATARCRDGTYTFGQHRRGKCPHHLGVEETLTRGADGKWAVDAAP